MPWILIRLMLKTEYLIVQKGTKFTGSGKLWKPYLLVKRVSEVDITNWMFHHAGTKLLKSDKLGLKALCKCVCFIHLSAGKLTMIVGQVGAGKSSLLSAMLGEMVALSGNVQFNRYKAKKRLFQDGRVHFVLALKLHISFLIAFRIYF